VGLDRHIKEGEYLSCSTCDADLELISLHPLVLDWADDGFETLETTQRWRGNAKRSKRDKKKGSKARTNWHREFGYVD
jgi:hypothetical protein